MNDRKPPERGSRRAVIETLASTAGLWLVGCAAAASAQPASSGGQQREAEHAGDDEAESDEAEVTPGEDLMQEHGVVERVLLIYDEVASRIERGERADLSLIVKAAGIVKVFVEDYHEKNEEKFIFPRLEAAHRQVDLVATLRAQHEAGRQLTAALANATTSDATQLTRSLRAFARMYRPHAAWEDTVVFPTFRQIVGRADYHELGEQFEHDEHARFGEHGFEDTVAQLASIEQALGIDGPAKYTPS